MSDTSANNKRIAKNTLYMYIRMIVMMVISLFTTRITFNILGVDNYGIYNIVGSIIVFFTFINLALTTATRRYITAEIATGTSESRQNVFNLAQLSHGIIAMGIFVIAELIGVWIVNYLLNLPSDRMFAANVVYQLSVFSAMISIMQAPYTAVITAHEKMSIYAYYSVIEAVLKLLGVLLLYVIAGDKLIIYAVIILFCSVSTQLLYRLYCKRHFPECKYKKPEAKHLLKEMFSFMGWSLFGQAAVVMTNQGVSVLVNIFFSVAANAAMGISNQITHIVSNFVNSFQTAFQPQITKLYVKRDFDELVRLTIRSSRMSSYLVMFFMVPVIFQVDNFLTLWLGDYPEYAVEFCIYTLLAIYLETIAAPFWMINYSDTKLRSYQIGSAVIFSLCFFIGWFVLRIGLPPFSVVVVRSIVMGLMIPYRLYMVRTKVSEFPIWRWVKEALINSIVTMAGPCIMMHYFGMLHFDSVLLSFIVNCIVCVFLMTVAIYTIGLHKNERQFINNKICAIIKKA